MNSIRRTGILLCLSCLFVVAPQAQETPSHNKFNRYRIAFWNVENFFDTRHDTLKNDAEFTPQGDKHWTNTRFEKKKNQIFKTVLALGDDSMQTGDDNLMPILFGMAEVENDYVLRQLCSGTPLRQYNYDFIHYESPDERGIDVALLYRPDLFSVLKQNVICMSDSTLHLYTRDILEVFGTTQDGDSLVIFVCHFPSKRGGATAETQRIHIGRQLRQLMDSAATQHPSSLVIAMGDFNSAPDEECLVRGIGIPPRYDTTGKQPYVNLMGNLPVGQGSYNYRGDWSYIDQFFISAEALTSNGKYDSSTYDKHSLYVDSNAAHVFRGPFLMAPATNTLDSRPMPTYRGPRYIGGTSDHLPIYITLSRKP